MLDHRKPNLSRIIAWWDELKHMEYWANNIEKEFEKKYSKPLVR